MFIYLRRLFLYWGICERLFFNSLILVFVFLPPFSDNRRNGCFLYSFIVKELVCLVISALCVSVPDTKSVCTNCHVFVLLDDAVLIFCNPSTGPLPIWRVWEVLVGSDTSAILSRIVFYSFVGSWARQTVWWTLSVWGSLTWGVGLVWWCDIKREEILCEILFCW
jgi:hypothetical protein